jgi:hypothetical protein
MTMDARTTLSHGRGLLDDLLVANGFTPVEPEMPHDTAAFARIAYVKDNRRLELGCREQLAVVVYQVDALVVTHDAFMAAVLGPAGSNMYPCFTGDPLDGFRHLRHDLENYAGAFLHGTEEGFRTIVRRAQEMMGHQERTTLYRR